MEVYTARLDSLDTYCCDHEVAEADMRWVAAPSSLPGATVTMCTQQPMPCSPEDDAQTACDPWLSCSLAWEDWSRMPADWKQRGACCTLTLRCCKGCEVRELGSSAGAPDQVSDAWQRQEEVVICKLARWSEVKQAVLDGFTLAAALAVLFRDSCGSSGGSSRGSSDDGGNPGWPGGTASSAASSPTSSSGGGGSGSCSSVSSIGGAGPVGLDDCLFIPGGGPGTFASAKGAYLNGEFADVVIRVGDTSLRAHRLVLSVASPVFHTMLTCGMQESTSCQIDLSAAAEPAAVQLLLQHLYGGDVAVPLALAVQMYGLADLYRLSSDLGWRLRLWLSAARMQAAALCRLLPAMQHACPRGCVEGAFRQAAGVIDEIQRDPDYGASWPFECVLELVRGAPLLPAFKAAASWAAAKPSKGRQIAWSDLISALDWSSPSHSDLAAIRAHVRRLTSEGVRVPEGLGERLVEAFENLCGQLAESVGVLRGEVAAKVLDLAVVSSAAAEKDRAIAEKDKALAAARARIQACESVLARMGVRM